MSFKEVRPVVGRLAASAEALAVLATSVGKPLDGQPAQVREVLLSLGLESACTELGLAEAEFVNGLVRKILLQALEFLAAPDRPSGWPHVDPRSLQGHDAASASSDTVQREVVAQALFH